MNTYPDFLVRIDCMTYNHAPYIEDAMNGFCMQQTTFPFVATIIDDASTDGEPEVIRSYLDAHFDLSEKGVARQWETDDAYFIYAQHRENKNCYFAVVLLKYNFYSINKSKAPLIKEWTNTKYVAFCEGDDYWIEQKKLKSQIDYMESHTECGMVYSQIKQYVQVKKQYIDGWCKESNFDDMLVFNAVCTLTVCMRTSLYNAYTKKYSIIASKRKWKMGDYPLWLYAFGESKVHFINIIMGIYRILQESASHTSSFVVRMNFNLSAFDIRLFFAKTYNRTDYYKLHPKLLKNQLLLDAMQYDENIPLSWLWFVLRHSIDNFKEFKLSLMGCSKLGRFILAKYSKLISSI